MIRAVVTRLGPIRGLVSLLLAMPAAAQTLPATSGSPWFYSPGHYPPFHQFRTPDRGQIALIPRRRFRREDNAGLRERPC